MRFSKSFSGSSEGFHVSQGFLELSSEFLGLSSEFLGFSWGFLMAWDPFGHDNNKPKDAELVY